jgi:hypothetical protein
MARSAHVQAHDAHGSSPRQLDRIKRPHGGQGPPAWPARARRQPRRDPRRGSLWVVADATTGVRTRVRFRDLGGGTDCCAAR